MTKASELVVVGIGWDAVTVTVSGENKRLTWHDLRAAAKQDDADLRAVYAGLLADAKKMARGRRALKVAVHNISGHDSDAGALTWAATLHYMGGETATGRLVAADWGQTGSRSYAMRDAEEAKKVLTQRGYKVKA